MLAFRGKLYFEKYIGDKYYTLEPEAYLLYVPVGNQDENPIFDTGLKALKYSLFSENKFYGEDRINDAKQMTLALTHRIIDENSEMNYLLELLVRLFILRIVMFI